MPFTSALHASAVYPEAIAADSEDKVLIQGVVDLLFAEADGLVLVDYKTDSLVATTASAAAERHRFQIESYSTAVGSIAGKPVREAYVYFFDTGESIRLL